MPAQYLYPASRLDPPTEPQLLSFQTNMPGKKNDGARKTRQPAMKSALKARTMVDLPNGGHNVTFQAQARDDLDGPARPVGSNDGPTTPPPRRSRKPSARARQAAETDGPTPPHPDAAHPAAPVDPPRPATPSMESNTSDGNPFVFDSRFVLLSSFTGTPEPQTPPVRLAPHRGAASHAHRATGAPSRVNSTPCTPGRLQRTPGTPRTIPFNRARPAPKSSRGRDVSEFFVKVDGRKYCTFCQALAATDPTHNICSFGANTSSDNARRHLAESHLPAWLQECRKKGIRVTAKGVQEIIAQFRGQQDNPQAQGKPLPRKAFSREAFLDAICQWIAADDQSVNVIDNPYLRQIFLMLREDLRDCDIPHRTRVRERLLELVDKYFDSIEAELGNALGTVSFTTDIWSDPNRRPFMAVTGHWICEEVSDRGDGCRVTNLVLRSELLAFIALPGRHTGEHIAHAFLNIVERVGLLHKIGWITVDNASNNDKFVTCLEELLTARNISFSACFRHIRCFPHIVNLCCKAVLSAIGQVDYRDLTGDVPEAAVREPSRLDPIAKLRALTRPIRASSLQREYFSHVVKALMKKDLQLLRDIDIRWSSTLLMIERAILLREAITQYLRQCEVPQLQAYRLTDAEWQSLIKIQRVLEVPHAFQQVLSAEKTPTLCSALPAFKSMQGLWESLQADTPELESIIQPGLKKLDTYQKLLQPVPAYTLAMFVNPRLKLNWIRTHQPWNEESAMQTIKSELLKLQTALNLTTHYRRAEPAPQQRSALDSATRLLGLDNYVGTAPNTLPTAPRDLDHEIELYLRDSKHFDSILAFWQKKRLQYPTIFALACNVLPIQASAVPCERIFSSAKETTTPRRNRIGVQLMEALQILKFSFRHGGINFTAGTGRDDELNELEELGLEDCVLPEDLASFARGLAFDDGDPEWVDED